MSESAEIDFGLAAAADELDDAVDFDDSVVTGVLEKALGERDRKGGSLADRVGIGGTALAILLMLNIPGHPVLAPDDYVLGPESEEQGWVRDLLLRHLSTDAELSRWLAAIIARRAMEEDHLWEDLGLPDRPALRTLLERHFAPLAARNTNSMRWKRFFYRVLCEEEGIAHCTSPTCGSCPDVDRCFEPASAEHEIARTKHAPA